jgi:hypothetical protein
MIAVLLPGVAEELLLDPEPEILDGNVLQSVQFIGEDNREFLGGIGMVQLPMPDLAHGGENMLVVTVPEPEATGSDLVLVQAGACQRFYAVPLGNPGVQMPVREQENLADRSNAARGFPRLVCF